MAWYPLGRIIGGTIYPGKMKIYKTSPKYSIKNPFFRIDGHLGNYLQDIVAFEHHNRHSKCLRVSRSAIQLVHDNRDLSFDQRNT